MGRRANIILAARNRRLMAHYEAFALIAEGYAKLAMICIMLKRLAGPKLSRAT